MVVVDLSEWILTFDISYDESMLLLDLFILLLLFHWFLSFFLCGCRW